MADTTPQGEGFMSETFSVRVSENAALQNVLCRWQRCGTALSEYFHAIDLLISVNAPQTEQSEHANYPEAKGTVLETLVRQACNIVDGDALQTDIVVKVILAPRAGYICRSDILDLRMRHSEFVSAVIPFTTWRDYLPRLSEEDSILPLLRSSPGALLVKQSTHHSSSETLHLLQDDLAMRLSFPWTLPTQSKPRRVAVVGGRGMYDVHGKTYGSQGFFEAAHALGVSLIVLDERDHWLAGETYAHLREEFIALDLSARANLPDRIAAAVRGRAIDGIVTFTDEYVVTTAEAAEILGLPTEPAPVMRQAHHKHEMRRLLLSIHDDDEANNKVQAVRLHSATQLDHPPPALAKQLASLQYPLVVKPCRGQFSTGVKKVSDEASLRQAVAMLGQDNRLAEQGIMLETYISGPELDANFVLVDGAVLFLEVTDNFPCSGDDRSATLAANFAETLQISNTRFPAREVEAIREKLSQSLRALGFRSGVFHVEARMRNSAVWYERVDVRDGDGKVGGSIMDLVAAGESELTPPPSPPAPQPDPFLIEVNVRPPGTGGTWSTLYTYGVDLGALHLLRALNDRDRFCALSSPFLFPGGHHPGDGGGAQYWNAHCMVPVHRDWVRVPGDFFEQVYEAMPEIVPHVSRAELSVEPGTLVPSDGEIPWIGYLLMHSRVSRRHLLEMYARFAGACRRVLDAASGDDLVS
ncbi:uncharacterized protein NFIA_062270 [Aspergillus fischeri NRRL 181]|uniref:ATP-grasp domain-containing protein n=1 Tax=Neosartorya fischeri (strain ATCC 1020 / DSM 3700 / CBS 544.65 / FGSC A1164 / JCM 1740 / NRRL 181 / WB 181) TaxID=331117 RepID=A1D5S2_NEOFI|nr:conserved hypothetical protein [Aspergillus fischeri NRRL 181]EAW21066.1 conserved hypothetical protein [Aspergillus fischeri NRRL 181]KAG2019264.1 hypothetical protein GB937_005178 [Aspergillus fischeri]